MTLNRPLFREGTERRKLTADERQGREWKYLFLKDVTAFSDKKICKGKYHLIDQDGVERGRIYPYGITVRAGYAWNGSSDSPDLDAVILASGFHDLLYQFSACVGFPQEITRKWADDMFYELCDPPPEVTKNPATWVPWLLAKSRNSAYRAGLWLGSWSAWRQSNFGCRVERETQ